MDFESQNNSNQVADKLTGNIQKFGFKKGLEWMTCGFDMFKAKWPLWIGAYCLFLLLSFLISYIPFVGSIVAFIIAAGLYVIASNQDHSGGFKVQDMFEGFKTSLMQLATLAIFKMLLVFLCFGTMLMNTGVDFENPESITPEQLQVLAEYMGYGFCLYLIPNFAFIFSPTLIVLHRGVSPYEAMALSFKACIVNIFPILAFTMVFFALVALSFFTFFLTLIPLFAISIIGVYQAQKDIFCVVSDSEDDQQQPPSNVMSA